MEILPIKTKRDYHRTLITLRMIRNLHEELDIPAESLIMADRKTASRVSRRSVGRNQGTEIRIHCKDGPIAASGSYGRGLVPAQGLKRRHKR